MTSRTHLHVLGNPKCPATFCPLFASQGSPWTGEKDRECERALCGFFHRGFDGEDATCHGADMSREVIAEMALAEHGNLDQRAPMPECKFAGVCQWQHECGDAPCPPRWAVMIGVDPVYARG